MFTFLSLSFLVLLPANLLARDIIFPPVDPLQVNSFGQARDPSQYRSPIGSEKDLLLEFQKYSGLSTFSNLPWVHCLSPEDQVDKYDIAFLGAPFDTGTTGRPGARFGPAGIRW